MLRRFRRGELRLSRIEAFSDGVFAIVVTLLVLGIAVPELRDRSSVAELGGRLVALLPKLLSWFISFIIVCKFWLNHHHVLGLARHADYGLVWLNSLFLMCQSFVPFPTALMGDLPRNPLAVSFFGGVLAVNTLVFILLHWYVRRNLMRPEARETEDPHIIAKSFSGPVCYGLGALAAWVSIDVAFAAYLLTPLFFITPSPPRRDAGS
jgi:uncharacterized membrane protein